MKVNNKLLNNHRANEKSERKLEKHLESKQKWKRNIPKLGGYKTGVPRIFVVIKTYIHNEESSQISSLTILQGMTKIKTK